MLRSLLFVLCLLVAPAWADTTRKIPMRELERRGIFPRNFSVFRVAGDGRTILAADEPPFNYKARGIFHRLWLIRLTPDLKIESAKGYNLPIPQLEQANFTPDLRSVLVSSRRGANIHKLDLESGEFSVLQSHEPGQPGFRIHSDIFSLYNGKMYTVGYFYDQNDYTGPEQMVEIDPTRTGKQAFTPVVDLAPIQEQLKNVRIASLLAPGGLIFYTEDQPGKHWTVYRWSQASGLTPVDEGVTIEGSWGEGPVGVYSIRRAGGVFDLVMLNAQTGQRTVLGTSSSRYVNPCMANEANTVVTALEEAPDTYSYWVGQDLDGFTLRKVWDKAPVGTLRVSFGGQLVCHYNPAEGLTLIQLGPSTP